MISPGSFYEKNDLPDAAGKFRMWRNIIRGINRPTFVSFFIADQRSFLWGMAVSVILYFTSVGIYTTVRENIRKSQPQVVRLDAAYQSAIKEFENVVPRVLTAGRPATDYLSTRKEQLKQIDSAIAGLKYESTGADLSALKQKRLRELYSMKLHVLQEMIENGEIEL